MNSNSTNGATRITQALAYARREWRIHPLYGSKDGLCACGKAGCTGNSRGKHPILSGWQNKATIDERTIIQWFEEWPDMNIGIATGKASGLVVVDIDPQHGGNDSLKILEHKFGNVPHTVEAITGNGGRHLLFSYPENVAHIPNAASLAGYHGIDVRSDGGYIVAPPSVHYSGRSYEWESSSHPDKIPLAPLPEWLLRLLINEPKDTRGNQPANEPGWVSKRLAGVIEGERDTTCIKLAGHFRKKNLDFDTTITILEDWAAKCVPPFPNDRVTKCVQSAYSYPNEEEEKETTKSKTFSLTSLSDLLAEPEDTTAWLWEETLPEGGLSLVTAKPKVGKSTWTRNLVLKVARGEPFLGRGTSKGPVIYLALEEKRSEIQGHFIRMGAEKESIFIHVGSAPAESLAALEDAIADTNAKLAIVDPLFRMVRITDGNDYAQVNRALEPLLMLARNTGCHILAVHHMGKGEREGGDAILGSTALFAAVDTALFMKKREIGRTIESTQRYGEDIPKTALNFDPETGIMDVAGTLEYLEIERVKQAIMEELSDSSMAEKEIREIIGGNTGLVGKGLRELLNDEQIRREGTGKKGDPYMYQGMLVSSFNL